MGGQRSRVRGLQQAELDLDLTYLLIPFRISASSFVLLLVLRLTFLKLAFQLLYVATNTLYQGLFRWTGSSPPLPPGNR